MKKVIFCIFLLFCFQAVSFCQQRRPPGRPGQQIGNPVLVPLPESIFLNFEVFASYKGEDLVPKLSTSRPIIIGIQKPMAFSNSDRIRAEECRRFALSFTRNIILVDDRKTFEDIASGQTSYCWIWLEAYANPPVENWSDPQFCRASTYIWTYVFNEKQGSLLFYKAGSYGGTGRGLFEKVREDFFKEGTSESFFYFSLRWTYRRAFKDFTLF